MKEEKLNDVCKKCGLFREDHIGMWKVTDCKFAEVSDSEEGK